jgi:hypothetical protein
MQAANPLIRRLAAPSLSIIMNYRYRSTKFVRLIVKTTWKMLPPGGRVGVTPGYWCSPGAESGGDSGSADDRNDNADDGDRP